MAQPNGYSNNLYRYWPSFCMANTDISYWNSSKRSRSDKDPNYLLFSDWNYDHFAKVFRFEFNTQAMTKFTPERLDIDLSLVIQLSHNFTRACIARGAIVHWKESARCDLISQVFDTLVSEYYIKGNHSIKFVREHYYGDKYSAGYVEFVIKSHTIILMIIQVKKDDMDKGILQNAIELHQAGQQNGNNIIVYGAITNLTLWTFSKYTPGEELSMSNWALSDDMVLAPSSPDQINQENWVPFLTKLTGYLNWMLTEAIGQLSNSSDN